MPKAAAQQQYERRKDDRDHKEIMEKIKEVEYKVGTMNCLDDPTREKINSMYKILVTGNGTPPLPEQVRNNAAWIEEQKDHIKIRAAQTRTLINLAIGQVFGLIALFVAILLRLK